MYHSQLSLPTSYSDKPTVDQITPANAERLSPWILPKNNLKFYHYHDFIEIGYCFEGTGTHYDENRQFSYGAGDCLLAIPGRSHYTVSAPDADCKWMVLYFDYRKMLTELFGKPDLFRSSSLNPEITLYGIISRAEHPSVCDQVLRITEQYRNFQTGRRELLCALFLELVFLLQREQAPLPPSHISPVRDYGDFKKTVHYISDTIESGRLPDVAELAEYNFMSVSYFRKEFTKAVGTAPYDFILRTAILRVQKLLMTTDDSILKICSEVGFKSISSLNRNFQMQCGLSPREYRKMHQSLY